MRTTKLMLLLSLLLIGCSNNEAAIEVESEESVEENAISNEIDVSKLKSLLDQDKTGDVLREVKGDESEIGRSFFNLALAKQSLLKGKYDEMDSFLANIENPSSEIETEINKIKEQETAKKKSERPISDLLKEQGYITEELQELEGVQKGESKYQVTQDLVDKGIDYEFVCNSTPCYFMVYANGLAVLNPGMDVQEIMYIKNQNGQIVNPLELNFIEKEGDRLAEVANAELTEQHMETLEEREQRHKEEKTIRIGMTSEEVLERWGQPEDINRTITAGGTDEQWVYLNAYVYFEDGILTTIQN